jgi:hypothetical protein
VKCLHGIEYPGYFLLECEAVAVWWILSSENFGTHLPNHMTSHISKRQFQRLFSRTKHKMLVLSLSEYINKERSGKETMGTMRELRTVLFLFQAELEEMDRKVRAAIRRRNGEDLLLFVALAFVFLFFLWLIFF